MERRRDESNGNLCCSFCGKSQKEVKKLIAGPTVYICDECIALCNAIIAEEEGMSPISRGQRRGEKGRRRAIRWWQRPFGRGHKARLQASMRAERGLML